MTATAFFTSIDSGRALQTAVVETITSAALLAEYGTVRVDLQIMCFAFTDRQIAGHLLDLLRRTPRLNVRIVADWSQSAPGRGPVLTWLAGQRLPNLHVKFKIDLPYRWDAGRGRMVWSYGQSLGMLHHKTLMVRAAGRPVALILGSYNWSARGRKAYENLMLLDDRPEHAGALASFDAEFEALWSDHRLTAAPGRAAAILDRVRAELPAGADLADPDVLQDIAGTVPLRLSTLPAPAAPAGPRRPVAASVIAAFSGQIPGEAAARAGFAPANDRRGLNLLRPSGARRPAPLTLNTLALEAIRGVPDGATLSVAMYALSRRVPEFLALIEAARRGVAVRLLLDRTIGGGMAAALADLARREGLPLTVASSARRMHQKYLVCPETGMVVTGTANMTEDATLRHADHRLLFRSAPALAAAFQRDFDTIWARLPQAEPAGGGAMAPLQVA